MIERDGYMIPKKIHYCWFGKGKKSKLALKCIRSWRQYCPEYEVIEWNEENFDIDMNGYTRMCYAEKVCVFKRLCQTLGSGKSMEESILIQM